MRLDRLELKDYTYQELCEVLDEEEKTNREKQYERWKRFFDYIRVGRKFRVIRIKENPIPDARSRGNNSKYIDYYEDIIMYVLNKSDGKYQSFNEWLINCKLVNRNICVDYSFLARENRHMIPFNREFYMFNCQMEVKSFISAKFRSAIERLERDGYITSKEGYLIVDADDTERIASSIEEQQIEEVKQIVLDNNGCKSLGSAIYKKKAKKVYSEIDEELNKRYNYKKAFYVLGLFVNKESSDYVFKNEDINETLKQLRKLNHEGLENHFIKKIDKNIIEYKEKTDEVFEKLLLGEDFSKVDVPFQLDEEYANYMISILDVFLSP